MLREEAQERLRLAEQGGDYAVNRWRLYYPVVRAVMFQRLGRPEEGLALLRALPAFAKQKGWKTSDDKQFLEQADDLLNDVVRISPEAMEEEAAREKNKRPADGP